MQKSRQIHNRISKEIVLVIADNFQFHEKHRIETSISYHQISYIGSLFVTVLETRIVTISGCVHIKS